jgi:ElaB/YqjD/DUF883 family membrane-anchored ribosome-binding protein
MKTSSNEGIGNGTVDRVASGAHEAVDKMAGAATDGAEALSNKGRQLKQVQDKWVHELRDYVNDNPVTALGIAVAGGYLLSRILSGR